MQPEQIIDHIDEWLNQNGWHITERTIDFALDLRQLVAELEVERAPALAGS